LRKTTFVNLSIWSVRLLEKWGPFTVPNCLPDIGSMPCSLDAASTGKFVSDVVPDVTIQDASIHGRL